jgi:hypothetical protein
MRRLDEGEEGWREKEKANIPFRMLQMIKLKKK